MQDNLPPDATLAVVPEGAMINYLTRRKNPTGQLMLLPVEMAMYGEANVLAQFRTGPPGYILLLDRNTSEFGKKGFGKDYGLDLQRWIDRNYHPISAGSHLLQRNATAGS